MAEQAPSASSGTEMSDEANNGHERPQANAIVARQGLEDTISALPPYVNEHFKKVHEHVFDDITPSSLPRPRSNFVATLLRYLRRGRLPRIYERQFTRVIRISVIDEKGQSRTVEGKAMIDYWNLHGNLVSRSFGEKLFGNLDSAAPYPLVDSLGGVAKGIKKFTATWQCIEDRSMVKALFKFDPKMESSDFDVMALDHGYQVILSCHDIVRLNLLNLGRVLPFAAPVNFRSQAMSVNDHTAAAEEAAAALRRQEAEEARQLYKEYETRRDEYAYAEARGYAHRYGEEQVAIYGPQAYRAAYHRVYQSRYNDAFAWFTRTYPPP